MAPDAGANIQFYLWGVNKPDGPTPFGPAQRPLVNVNFRVAFIHCAFRHSAVPIDANALRTDVIHSGSTEMMASAYRAALSEYSAIVIDLLYPTDLPAADAWFRRRNAW